MHASVKRARASGLLHGPGLDNRPNLGAWEEFLYYGLKYAFPAERGELTRGVATSYGAAPLRSLIAHADDPIPVWPYEAGEQRGVSLAPLYKTAPIAALRDQRFYELLALADTMRDARVRERMIAEAELHERLHHVNAESNVDQLIATAALLRPLLRDLVFVGGAVTGITRYRRRRGRAASDAGRRRNS